MAFGLQEHMNKLSMCSTSYLSFLTKWLKKLFDRNNKVSPCNYIWACLHTSPPQSLSCCLILDAAGYLFLIYKFMFQPLPPFFQWRNKLKAQNQTFCLVYLEERDKCGFCLFQGTHINHAWEGVQGVWRGGRVEEISVCWELTAFTHFKTVKTSPSHHWQLGLALVSVSGDKTAACHNRVRSEMLSRGVGLTTLQRVNLYPTVTPDPDPVTKVCRET